jgi:serine/threonine protein kinase
MKNMDKDFIDNFLIDFDESRFPLEFLQNYETLECLANGQMGETLLVKERQTGNFCVAKCYSDKSLLAHTTEGDVLKIIHNDRLPAFVAEYQNEEMLCVVREYIEGISLDKYIARHKLSQDQIISLVIQLCNDITYLHEQKPPIIHRDIKPQNIVIDESGRPRLIDFGSCRIYDVDAQEDTVCFGTRHFAAPEQYGFSQTDCRTDIFALGVLLAWLLTSDTNVRTSIPAIKNKNLQRIVKKCTAFSPDRRYASAAQVKAALINVDSQRQKKMVQGLIGVTVCTAFLCLGFVIGRFTEITPAFLTGSELEFEEPLVEQAVRLSLGKKDGEPISQEDILMVTELYIYGDQPAASSEEFEALGQRMVLNDGTVNNGNISSLKDLSSFTNLKIINIALENISDLTPLSGLDKLEKVVLKHNPVEDVTPLAGLRFLKEIVIFDSRVTDLNSLASCPSLESIDIGKSYVTSIDSIRELKNLSTLAAKHTVIESLTGIEVFSRLKQIRLSNIADGDLSPLLLLPELEMLYLDEALRDQANPLRGNGQFQIIFD